MGCAIEIWGLAVITSFAQGSLAERLSTFHEEVFLDFAYTTAHMHTHAHTHTHTAPLWYSLSFLNSSFIILITACSYVF